MPIVRVSKRSGGVRSRRPAKLRARGGRMMSASGKSYLRTILNPSFAGAKVPDAYGAKTCTIQLQREKKIDVTAGGIIAGALQVSIAPYVWFVGSTNTTWSGDAFVDGSSTYDPINGQTPVVSKLPTLFRAARVVSAGLKVQFVGNTQNDQGTITVFALDRGHMASQTGLAGGTPAQIGNPDFFNSVIATDPVNLSTGDSLRTVPINAFGPVRQGATARWYPMDDQDLVFHPYRAPVAGSAPTTAAATGVGTVGGLGFWCEGLAGGSSVIVQYTVNLECTVRDDAYNLVSTESSPVDPYALQAAASVYLRKPQVRVGGGSGDTESTNVYNR